MKIRRIAFRAVAFVLISTGLSLADQSAKVTQAVNHVVYGSRQSEEKSLAHEGTVILDGGYLETGANSRAEMRLPSTCIARLGAETIFNFTADSNTVDLREGDILFCKPKSVSSKLNIETSAITAGISGTTGFVSIQGSGSKKTYIFGIIEGHATASAGGKPFLVGAGEIIEFKPGMNPFKFAFDLPRFVKSTSLLRKFTKTLPNQSYIDRAVADYQDDLSRGFIQAPKRGIDYSGDIPVYSTVAYDSAQSSQGGNRNAPPPPPPSSYGQGSFSPSGP